MNILIFDMDGVLIDVSKSYRRTIQQTVHTYIETCLGFRKGKDPLVTNEVISLFKSAGGFNNDWDLTSGILLYLLSTSGMPPFQRRNRYSSMEDLVRHLRTKSSRYFKQRANQIKKKHLTSFLAKVKSSGGGLDGVKRVLMGSWGGWVYSSGNLDKENLVKRIFQEIYLGEKFTPYYHLPRIFYRGSGHYLKERMLIPRNILAALRKKLRLAIASGRPRFEAELALKRFHLLPYFDSVVTLDECEEEERQGLRSARKKIKYSKPNPYSLLRTVQEVGIPHPHCAYVGDVVDDMLAAKAAKKELPMLAIGFLSGHAKRKARQDILLKAGADLLIGSPKELLIFLY